MFEKSGVFSVRSCYCMIVETKRRREDWLESRPGASNRQEENSDWKRLWKTTVPAKIRVFCGDLHVNLSQRKMSECIGT